LIASTSCAALGWLFHGFEIDRPGTDTQRFSAAGADLSAIAGPDMAAFTYHLRREPSLAEVQALVRGVDLILVEGYGQQPVPKIEVRRRGVASDKPAPVGQIFAIVSDDDGNPAAVRWDDLSELVDRLEREVLTGWVFGRVGGGES
jgi:molybdopterin-guanine dinucleotide biosynthesis protein MobB